MREELYCRPRLASLRPGRCRSRSEPLRGSLCGAQKKVFSEDLTRERRGELLTSAEIIIPSRDPRIRKDQPIDDENGIGMRKQLAFVDRLHPGFTIGGILCSDTYR